MTARPRLFLALAITCCAVLGCGGGGDDPDARIIQDPIDASPPDAFVPVCTMTMCGTECVDTATNEEHCNGCNMPCQSGASCEASACVCPESFLPADLSGNPLGQDMVRGDVLPGAFVAIAPFISSQLNIGLVGYAETHAGMTFTLSGDNLGTPPFVAAGYDVDISTMMVAGAYYATAGTLRLNRACDTGVAGRLTNATFQAVAGIMDPTIDPDGCSFDVDDLVFSIGDPSMCPAPN